MPITLANFDRFSKCFTFGLSSDCVMNWFLKTPSHLKRVDTLPCKTLMFKVNLISTLINTSCSLFVVRHEHINWIIVSSDIWIDLVIYAAISHYHFFYKFCWSLSFPLTLCASFAPPVGKCNNVRPVELPDHWPPNSFGLNTFHYKILGSESTTKSAGCEWFEAESVWCVNWSVRDRYWRWHW